jgi:hypothetical protein
MSYSARVSVRCPHCEQNFVENARLIRSGGQAWCPECERLFRLDPASHHARQALLEARAARARRRERLAAVRQRWEDPPRPAPKPPMLLGDVLARLDALLVRLDDVSRHPPAGGGLRRGS